MKKETFEQLESVLHNLINEDAKSADEVLREYLRAKAQALVLGEADEKEDEAADDKDEEADEKEDEAADDKDEEADEKEDDKDE